MIHIQLRLAYVFSRLFVETLACLPNTSQYLFWNLIVSYKIKERNSTGDWRWLAIELGILIK
jgi:hypothetical protein